MSTGSLRTPSLKLVERNGRRASSSPEPAPAIGLLAGSGRFPIVFAQAAQKRGSRSHAWESVTRRLKS